MITLREYAKQPDFGMFRDADEYLDFYCFLTHTRDSGILDNTNFECALEALGGESEDCVILRFGHWACGWIEHIFVSEKLKTKAEEMENSLADYPILNEARYSENIWNACSDYWEHADLRERIYRCSRAGISILQARHNEFNSDLFEELESCVGV